MADLVLAVDHGSTWCKARYFDRVGRVVAGGRATTRGIPAFGVTAADLERHWRAFAAAVRGAGAELAPDALALSSRIGLGVWLDERDRPVEVPGGVPLAAGEEEMDAVYGAPGWSQDTLPTYAPMLLARTLWLRRRHPALFARVRRAGALHDWLLLKLTGRWATNPATGPGWPAAGWPPAVFALTGLPLAAFPEVCGFAEPVGRLTAASAEELGLPAATTVVAGYHDGAAATAGTGCLAPGDTCVTLGTSVAIRVVSDDPPAGWFRYPVAPERWAWMRGLELALAQLDQVATLLRPGPVADAHRELTALAEALPRSPSGGGPGPLPPLPPAEAHRRAEAVDAALAAGHRPAAVYRAGLEGIAIGVGGLVVRARQAGLDPRRFVVTGGGASNPLLLGILGAVLGAPLELGEVEAGARGAALAAAVAAGWHASIADAARRLIPKSRTIAASAEDAAAYRAPAARIEPPRDPWLPRRYWRALAT
ncbi:MAG TPA: FGGY family carbohydrate kinase [Chloroflexota bacterium]|nr:FGGY family carbohydrate kinase [Chloroflexota bacterium]